MIRNAAPAALGLALLAAHAAAQQAEWPTWLYAVRAGGELLRLDPATGAATPFGSSGVPCEAARPWGDMVAVTGGGGAGADRVTVINRFTGTVHTQYDIAGRPSGYEVRGLAGSYVLLSPASGDDLLAAVDFTTSYTYVVIGPTGRDDLEALTTSPWGELYALGSTAGGALCTIDRSTGAATLIGGGSFDADTAALEFLPDGTLLACGQNLRSVDYLTGATTLIGPTGHSDIRGLAAVRRAGCYPDCNGCYSGNHCPPLPQRSAVHLLHPALRGRPPVHQLRRELHPTHPQRRRLHLLPPALRAGLLVSGSHPGTPAREE